MDIELLREYCLSKKEATEGFPFGESVLVFKVAGKMFLLTPLDGALQMNVKCEPEKCLELRERHPEVSPGYHMNKKMWNTVDLTGGLPDSAVFEMIDRSYDLVVGSLPKKMRLEFSLNQ